MVKKNKRCLFFLTPTYHTIITKMKQLSIVQLLTLLSFCAFGQYPATNIYVMDMQRVGEDYFKFDNPIFVNSDNANGYNNQPYFINDDELLVTSSRDGKQTDIFSYNFKTLQATQLSDTKSVSEFSPTVIPNTQKKFSTICIEEDGKTQRLWEYSYANKNIVRKMILDKVFDVGYHEWLNTNQVALFIVGTPHQLKIANVLTKNVDSYTSNIGRCMKTLSNGDLLFVQKNEDGWYLKRLDILNLDIVTIAPTLVDSEDFALLSDNTVIMGKGDKLYKLNVDRDRQWKMIADLSSFSLSKITRIAVSDNKIAIVGN
jgi:hypothetical protein